MRTGAGRLPSDLDFLCFLDDAGCLIIHNRESLLLKPRKATSGSNSPEVYAIDRVAAQRGKQKPLSLLARHFLFLPPSWLTEAEERASGLTRAAASPVFQWLSNDQRDRGA
jgi:hypothetical protein